MPTTFVTLAIDHDETTDPAQWDWSALADHPDPVGLVGAQSVPEGSVRVETPQNPSVVPADAHGAVSVVVEVPLEDLLATRSTWGTDEAADTYDVAYEAAFGDDGFYTDGTRLQVVGVRSDGTLLVNLICVPSPNVDDD